jgi:hypothetical protein
LVNPQALLQPQNGTASNLNQIISSHHQQSAQNILTQQANRPPQAYTLTTPAVANNTQGSSANHSQQVASTHNSNIVQVQSASGHPMFIPILQNLNDEVIEFI